MNQVLADRYRIEAELARGAAGVVHRAHDLITDEAVAIKILHADAAAEPAVATAFLDEAEVLTELNHPAIVRPRDLIVNGTLMALVMDLVDGVDLRRVVIDGGPLSAHRAATVVAEGAEALAAVHAKGIVHGDVKPGNILIPTDGGTVRLVDFGVARRIASPDVPTHATPDYTAPEIIDGGNSTDKSDVYGLGLVLYEALCGASPYRGGGVDDVLERHRTLMPVRPTCIAVEVWNVVEACLALNPADRPAAAAVPSMLRAIMPLLSQEAVPAQKPQLRPRTVTEAGAANTHMGPAPVTTGGVESPPASVALSEPVAIPETSSDSNGRNKSKLLVATAAGIVALAAVGVVAFAWLAGPTGDADHDGKPRADQQTSQDSDSKDTKDKKNNEDDSTPTSEPSSTGEPTPAPTGETGGNDGAGGDSGDGSDTGESEGELPGEGPIGSTFPDKPGGG